MRRRPRGARDVVSRGRPPLHEATWRELAFRTRQRERTCIATRWVRRCAPTAVVGGRLGWHPALGNAASSAQVRAVPQRRCKAVAIVAERRQRRRHPRCMACTAARRCPAARAGCSTQPRRLRPPAPADAAACKRSSSRRRGALARALRLEAPALRTRRVACRARGVGGSRLWRNGRPTQGGRRRRWRGDALLRGSARAHATVRAAARLCAWAIMRSRAGWAALGCARRQCCIDAARRCCSPRAVADVVRDGRASTRLHVARQRGVAHGVRRGDAATTASLPRRASPLSACCMRRAWLQGC